jgi:enolase
MLILTLSLQFDTDYEEFKQSVEALKEQLQLFVDSWFEKSLSVRQGVEQPRIISTLCI